MEEIPQRNLHTWCRPKDELTGRGRETVRKGHVHTRLKVILLPVGTVGSVCTFD